MVMKQYDSGDNTPAEMEPIEKRTLILGVGNILMQDEGVGVHLIHRLKEELLSPEVELVDGGTAGFDLIDIMEGYEKILILDAMDAGLAPGEIGIFTPEEVRDRSLNSSHSMHGYGVLGILQVAEAIGKKFAVTIIGIQPKSIGYTIGLSKEVETKIPKVIGTIKGLLA